MSKSNGFWEVHVSRLETFLANGSDHAKESDRKSTFVGNGGNIAGTMQDADDDDLVWTGQIIDRVFLVEDYAQVVCQMGAWSTGQWEL
jgi:hypothetical protein